MHSPQGLAKQDPWQWRLACDAHEVHRLLLVSDAYHATQDHPAPPRNWQTSQRHTANGAVHGLYYYGELVGMVTLTSAPPHGFDPLAFKPDSNPLYMQRLAVHPQHQRTRDMVGLRCVKRALEVATEQHATAVRAELNPYLTDVVRMLTLVGFVCRRTLRDATMHPSVIYAEYRLPQSRG